MTEIQVDQRSVEWHQLRQSVCITASCFGDAIGVGRGKPYHFLQSLLEPACDDDDSDNPYMQHGTCLEADINEAYQLLTGLETQPSGFWIADSRTSLAGIIGASPDAKVYQKGRFVGLAEYKAPVHKLYSSGEGGPHCRIRRSHMAQVQGQMAVCSAPWCDYMAVCTSTKQITLLRVHFAPRYWSSVSASLHNFCNVLQMAKKRQSRGLGPLDFAEAAVLKNCGMKNEPFDGEDEILVDDLLTTFSSNIDGEQDQYFKSLSETWMSYEFLVGKDPCSME